MKIATEDCLLVLHSAVHVSGTGPPGLWWSLSPPPSFFLPEGQMVNLKMAITQPDAQSAWSGSHQDTQSQESC